MVLSNVIDIVIDVNGVKKQVEKITDLTPANISSYNKVIWLVPRCKALFRDNIPVNLYYDIGEEPPTGTVVATPELPQDIMYLVPIGSINCNNEALQGFNSYDYVRTPIYIDWTPTNSFEFIFKLTTGSNVSTRQEIFSMTNTESHELEILNGKLHWELAGTYSTVNLTTNTNYWIRFTKNGQNIKIAYSRDGITFVEVISSTYNRTVKNEYMHFGVDKVAGGPVIEPFLGKFDLTQWSITYNNKKYNVKIHDDCWWQLLKAGNLNINNLTISNFSVKNYAYSLNYIAWSSSSEFEIYLKIITGNSVTTSQELITWKDTTNVSTSNSTNWLNNDFALIDKKIWWEFTQQYVSTQCITQTNTVYYIIFKRNGNTGSMQVLDANKRILSNLTIPRFPSTALTQYMYLGMDEMSLRKKFGNDCIFTGKFDLNECYIKMNNKKYKFRI